MNFVPNFAFNVFDPFQYYVNKHVFRSMQQRFLVVRYSIMFWYEENQNCEMQISFNPVKIRLGVSTCQRITFPKFISIAILELDQYKTKPDLLPK